MISMALPIHPTEGYNLDLMCPVIVCEVCEQIITSDKPGALLYDGDDFRVQHHVHKGQCDRIFEAFHHKDDRDSVRCLWRDLDEWLGQLVRNYSDPLTRPRDVTLSTGDTFNVTRWTTKAERGGQG